MIEKVLNNNVAIIRDEAGVETVVFGLGIAFRKRPGDLVDLEKIEKKFVSSETGVLNKLQSLMTTIPMEHFVISEEIIMATKGKKQWQISDIIYITLTDHISAAIDRYHNGLEMKNALTWDIKQLYPEEYEIGQLAVEKIADQYGVEFSEDEAAMIALHFVNARINKTEDMNLVHEVTEMMKEVMTIVKYHFHITRPKKTFEYYQFTSYLKNIAQNVLLNKNHGGAEQLIRISKEQYPETFKCILKIKKFFEQHYNYQLNGEFILILTVMLTHIVRQNKKMGL